MGNQDLWGGINFQRNSSKHDNKYKLATIQWRFNKMMKNLADRVSQLIGGSLLIFGADSDFTVIKYIDLLYK